MTGTPEPLTSEQRARVEALHQARAVLIAKGALRRSAPNAVEVVAVAAWILTGIDPWPVTDPPTPVEEVAE